MADATDDDTPRDARDLRIIWRTVTAAAIVIATVIGALIAGVVREVRQDARIEAVEKWQQSRDREAARELWRRDRERAGKPAP